MVQQAQGAGSAIQGKRMLAGDGLMTAGLLGLASLGWWWSARMTHEMAMGSGMSTSKVQASMAFVAFVAAWVAMMGAMMFPAIVPVVLIFRRAAARGQVAPTPIFVAGYLFVWSAIGVPVYFAWRALQGPVAGGAPWAARLAGGAFLFAAAYQVSPLKSVCLRHCRNPMSFFLRQHRNLRRPLGAVSAGVSHGLVCLGCCWALMAILVTLGTMQMAWMLAVAALIFFEKVTFAGERVAQLVAVPFSVLGVGLLIHPVSLGWIT
jgi:predicted metal-binding membrane protein